MALSIIGSRRTACWVVMSCCKACSRSASPAVEMLSPSRFATRSNSAFTTGRTHKFSWMSFLRRFPLWWVSVVCSFLGTVRISSFGGAGCGEAGGAAVGAGLSCHTPRTVVTSCGGCNRRGTLLRDNWVWAVFTICSLHRMKQAVRKKRKIGMSDVRVLLATLGCFALAFFTDSLPCSVRVYKMSLYGCSLFLFASFLTSL